MIKLSGKAKFLVPAAIIAAALITGFVLDRVHEHRFTVERLRPGETDPYAAATPTPRPDGQVNINKASVEELMQLNGIGEGLAKRITEYREQNGAFENVDELLNVSGIGDAKLEAIRQDICVE